MNRLLHGHNWSTVKANLSAITGLPDDALHILSGMLVLTIAAYLLRRPPWTWRPWLAVLVAETINEVYDLTQTLSPTDEGNWRASFHDFWLTLALPTLVLLLWPHFARSTRGGGSLAPLRRLWRSPEFRIGFAAAAALAILVIVWTR